ncbi:MAG: penicillin-binding protein 2 [Candidatus Adiutrix sp.]|jgi:penicillin-binding protein 2|nr:penicillin-binding protein 2 [Candidatus Adiutrix sp.]
MDNDHQPLSGRRAGLGRPYQLLTWGVFAVFLVLAGRLWHLQVVQGPEFLSRSDLNRTKRVDVLPVRGLIMDRNGVVLVDNRASFDLCVKKIDIKDPGPLLAELAELAGRPQAELERRYEALGRSGQNQCQTLIHSLSREQLVAVESRRYRLPGVSTLASSGRRPLSNVLASHVLGYLGEISQAQLDSERRLIEEEVRQLVREGETRRAAQMKVELQFKPHQAGDLMGQSGIERSLEYDLAGRRGYAVREVDSRGRVILESEGLPPEPGHSVRLTIDSRLQAMAMSLMDNRAGAIVVMDPRNFEILALASNPTFPLGDFSGNLSPQRWRSLTEDRFKPLLNRAIGGRYPPGSTFKIVTALAALDEGVVTPETTFDCHGSLELGDSVFNCHNYAGHGRVDLRKALMHSCDVYFYEVGRRLGIDRLARRAREQFGLGRRTGVDLLGEIAGVMPDTEWKRRETGRKWMPGETLPVAIGQGAVSTTPLQVAQFTAMLANGGRLYRPRLVKELVDIEGQTVRTFEPELVLSLDIPPRFLRAVQIGLEAAVGEPGGTGRLAALPGRRVAGKTGTSQVVSNRVFQSFSRNQVPYRLRDHAWFSSYAPAEAPEVVVTVLLEHAGGGGTFAAPVARQILAAYFDPAIVPFKLPRPQAQPDLEQEGGLAPRLNWARD